MLNWHQINAKNNFEGEINYGLKFYITLQQPGESGKNKEMGKICL
jgi:hypothetical protein